MSGSSSERKVTRVPLRNVQGCTSWSGRRRMASLGSCAVLTSGLVQEESIPLEQGHERDSKRLEPLLERLQPAFAVTA